jgi:hypothetical protein
MQFGIGRASADDAASATRASIVTHTVAILFSLVMLVSFAPVTVCDHHAKVGECAKSPLAAR